MFNLLKIFLTILKLEFDIDSKYNDIDLILSTLNSLTIWRLFKRDHIHKLSILLLDRHTWVKSACYHEPELSYTT